MKAYKVLSLSLSAALAGCLLSACATPPTNPEALTAFKETNDPLEPYNRAMTTFNFKVNEYIYQPFDKAYRFIFPEPVREGLSNASKNLSQPYYFVNALLQGELEDGAQIFGRFFTNTTLGIGGLFDVASALEIEAPQKDFGETLYRWGWQEQMPYFVWPFLGPSDIRETVGSIVGFFLNPLDYAFPKKKGRELIIAGYVLKGINAIDSSTELLTDVEKNSVDAYVKLRTMYRQNRSKFLNAGDVEVQTQSYDFDFNFDEEEEE